jgi:DNA-binding IclR family transcriptional regulator
MAQRAPSQPAHPISSVENALRLLVILRDRPEIRVSEASAELGVARSTAHRLLAMLHSFGLVEQHPTSRAYRVGPVLAEIGLSALRRVDVRAQLRPFLEELSADVGETVHLIVLEGRNCRFVDSVEGTRALQTTGRIGIAYPAHGTSGGKALLAELDEAQLLELYPDEALPPAPERALVDESHRTPRAAPRDPHGRLRGEQGRERGRHRRDQHGPAHVERRHRRRTRGVRARAPAAAGARPRDRAVAATRDRGGAT